MSVYALLLKPRGYPRDIAFIFASICIWLIAFGLARLFLFYWNFELSQVVPLREIFKSFWVGARFDLMMICWMMVPLVLGLMLPKGLNPRWFFLGWQILIGSAFLFAEVGEVEFYREFHARLNRMVIQYLSEDPATVMSMVLRGSPVIKLLLVWGGIGGLAIVSLLFVNRHTFFHPAEAGLLHSYIWRLPMFIMVLALAGIGARGTLRSGPPLRWGDAFHSKHLFANHLSLNGVFTLGNAILDGERMAADKWRKFTQPEKALSVTREMLYQQGDQWLTGENPANASSEGSSVLRESPPTQNPALPIENVVFIMLESFTARFTGALGGPGNVTPAFDQLANEGLLFTRFFSNGTHTHQGLFAGFASFPNLPDYEYLMQQPEGNGHFSGFARVLTDLGFKYNVYVYNGDFSWDNQYGFFKQQGINRFIGRNDFINPRFIDPTWGVCDEDMFSRSVNELDDLSQKGPFFAMLQSLSNHLPYGLPDSLPVAPVTGFGDLNQHLTAMRYSDWALGEFFNQIREKSWYKKTLFVIFGDHGFGMNEQITDIDLLRFQVPALFLFPGIQERFGKTVDRVGSQVDLVPTAAGLLGKTYRHACWGRNLLVLQENDPGFAVIKPSGSDKTVAIVKGDKLLVKVPNLPPRLYRYSVGYPAISELLSDTALNEALYQQLGGYIETALWALSERRL